MKFLNLLSSYLCTGSAPKRGGKDLTENDCIRCRNDKLKRASKASPFPTTQSPPNIGRQTEADQKASAGGE